jgi:uncharacterized Zn finger protein (UPF0148 family)
MGRLADAVKAERKFYAKCEKARKKLLSGPCPRCGQVKLSSEDYFTLSCPSCGRINVCDYLNPKKKAAK